MKKTLIFILALLPVALVNAQMMYTNNLEDEDVFSSEVYDSWNGMSSGRRGNRPVGPWLRISTPLISVAYDYTVRPWFVLGGGVVFGDGLWFYTYTHNSNNIVTNETSSVSRPYIDLASVLGGYGEIEFRTPGYRWSFFVNCRVEIKYRVGGCLIYKLRGIHESEYYENSYYNDYGEEVHGYTERTSNSVSMFFTSAVVGVTYKKFSLGIGACITGEFDDIGKVPHYSNVGGPVWMPTMTLSFDIPLKKSMQQEINFWSI